MAGRGFRQGFFVPDHPEKYIGNVDKIVYRSSWEQAFCRFLDHNTRVINWSSEEVIIPYVKPTDGRVHHYYVDFYVKYTNAAGEVKEELIEVKPKSQISAPVASKRRSKSKLYEQLTYAVNLAKWEAATKFAKEHGWAFRLVTEEQLFPTR